LQAAESGATPRSSTGVASRDAKKSWEIDGRVLRNLETNEEFRVVGGPYHRMEEVHRESNGYVFHHGARFLFVRDWDVGICTGTGSRREGPYAVEMPSSLQEYGRPTLMNDNKACPYCGESVFSVAVRCKRCGSAIGGLSAAVKKLFGVRPAYAVIGLILVALFCVIRILVAQR
jgi:hypothetical protein